MKQAVRDAINEIETGLMYGNPDALDGVDRKDVETLLAWAKRKETATRKLELGDKVALKIDWHAKPYTRKGAEGYVLHVSEDKQNGFLIDFGQGSAVWFRRHELKFVERKKH